MNKTDQVQRRQVKAIAIAIMLGYKQTLPGVYLNPLGKGAKLFFFNDHCTILHRTFFYNDMDTNKFIGCIANA